MHPFHRVDWSDQPTRKNWLVRTVMSISSNNCMWSCPDGHLRPRRPGQTLPLQRPSSSSVPVASAPNSGLQQALKTISTFSRQGPSQRGSCRTPASRLTLPWGGLWCRLPRRALLQPFLLSDGALCCRHFRGRLASSLPSSSQQRRPWTARQRKLQEEVLVAMACVPVGAEEDELLVVLGL